MPDVRPRAFIELEYEKAAEQYLRSLTEENFMEAPGQATQRKITLFSLDLVHAQRADAHPFNELLVQYEDPRPRRPRERKKRKPRQVVPDNMVVLWDGPLKIDRSYNVPLQPVG